ncbi:MAG: radical SAM protein [Desulfobacterales bacterium]|nr:MAG: radical SAM protein [Desulfobacterales bacterium]
MKVLLVSANTETINMPVLPLGLGCIARTTQEAGHDIHVLNLMTQEDPLKILKDAIKEFQPEAIGISVRNIDDQVMQQPNFLLEPVKSMISSCRKHSDAPIILGGAGYSIFPQSALNYLAADMGIQGEGETSFVRLLARLKKKLDLSEIPGLYLPQKRLPVKVSSTNKLDDLPMPLPGVHLWPFDRLEDGPIWMPFQTRRGCPLQCSYCSTERFEGRVLRMRDPEVVMQVISKYAQAGCDHFFFVDNVFNLPLSYAKALCDKIIAARLNISWRCILYPWKIDEALIKKMALAGCKEVSLGFESGSTTILQNMNKRFHPEGVRKISQTLKKYRIQQMGFLLFGGPGENKSTVQESLQYADSLNLDAMKITIGIRIYPHTMLWRQAIKQGVITPDDNLLNPKFYFPKDLEIWLPETVDEWINDRPNWFTS